MWVCVETYYGLRALFQFHPLLLQERLNNWLFAFIIKDPKLSLSVVLSCFPSSDYVFKSTVTHIQNVSNFACLVAPSYRLHAVLGLK